MSKSLYLINPRPDFPSYFTAEVYNDMGFSPATYVADLAITTVAGLAPSDFHIQLCEEVITPVNFDTSADFVGITGKITQVESMKAIAQAFRERGKVVIIGGPHASLCPDVMRPYCDILIQGEMESIAETLFADLRRGRWQETYIGDKPDLDHCVIPRWDLYPNEHAIIGNVQTSRGCPFECEFCDVITYLGRKQRHKPVAQVLRELDEVYRHGYRYVFLSDDNFTVHRSRAKEVLEGLRDWNRRQSQGPVRFITQVSIDAARDDDMLRMCAEAGLSTVFIGIETPNEESLRETKKRQNLKIDLLDQAQCFLDHGIGVTAGMIVGFDADGPDIFDRQYEFAMSSPIPIFPSGRASRAIFHAVVRPPGARRPIG